MSFIDDKGWRFLLPAFLIAELQDTNFMLDLWEYCNLPESQIFDRSQRLAFVCYLQFVQQSTQADYQNNLAINYACDPQAYRQNADYLQLQSLIDKWLIGLM